MQERKVLLTGNRNKWEQSMKERRDREVSMIIVDIDIIVVYLLCKP